MNQTSRLTVALVLLATILSPALTASAQGTAFTYQGRLNNNGSPVSGSYDLQFTLYTTNSSGSSVTGPVINSAVTVTNGLFTTQIDFGSGIFLGSSNWLDIAVRSNGTPPFVELTPRQPLTPTPYAVFANTASNLSGTVSAGQITGALPASQLSGTISSAQLSGSYSGTVALNNSGDSFSGNGGGLTNLSLTGIGPAGTFAVQPLFFGPPVIFNLPGAANCVLMADVNGDGKPDLIVGIRQINAPPYNNSGLILVYTNAGAGQFSLASTNLDTNNVTSLAVGDFNGDNKLDLAVADYAGYIIFQGNGDGTFTPVLVNNAGPISLAAGRILTVADVNGDGYPDLVLAENYLTNDVKVLLNFGGGAFAFTQLQVLPADPGSSLYSVSTADVNGDGRPDIITGGNAGLVVYTNRAPGLFTAASTNVSIYACNEVVGDVNGDGRPDIISWGQGGGILEVLTNAGGGLFISNNIIPVQTTLGAAVITNSAGLVTYVGAFNEFNSSLAVWANNGHGSFTQVASGSVGNSQEENPGQQYVTAGDVFGNGNPNFFSASFDQNTVTELNGFPQALSIQNPILLTNTFNSISGNFTGNFTGSGGAISNLNAAQITTGTLSDARLPADVALLGTNQTFTGQNSFISTGTFFQGGIFQGGNFSGRGFALTNLNASQLIGGQVPMAVLAPIILTNTETGVTLGGIFNGNGGGLTNLNALSMVNGLTTNLSVLVPGPKTNTMFFTNGILFKIQ